MLELYKHSQFSTRMNDFFPICRPRACCIITALSYLTNYWGQNVIQIYFKYTSCYVSLVKNDKVTLQTCATLLLSFCSLNFPSFLPDSVNVPALTIPIVFCTIGIVIVIVGTIYLNKLRKKPTIEVADFDFHPSMSTEGAGNYLSRLANKMKLIWFRNKYSKKHTNPDFHETTAKQYGATDEYESL